MGKLFGTDGIRGVANKELSVDLAMEVAQAAGTVIKEKIMHQRYTSNPEMVMKDRVLSVHF